MVLSDLLGILSSGFALVYLSRKRCGMRPAVLVTYRPPPVNSAGAMEMIRARCDPSHSSREAIGANVPSSQAILMELFTT